MSKTFKQWLNESQKTEFDCPHPEDKEFCRKWNLYLRGKGPMPVHQGRVSIGHYQGPKARRMLTDREKQRGGEGRKGGRYDWRKYQ